MIEYWHNPGCSKSRAGLALLQDRGVGVRARLYLRDVPNVHEIRDMWRALGQPPVTDMMRTGEKAFAEAGLSKSTDNAVLFQAMAAHPVLIERPIARSGTKAVIGRPTERLLDLL